jgi:hypothetical protein
MSFYWNSVNPDHYAKDAAPFSQQRISLWFRSIYNVIWHKLIEPLVNIFVEEHETILGAFTVSNNQ